MHRLRFLSNHCGIAVFLFLTVQVGWASSETMTFEEVKSVFKTSEGTLLDRNRKLIQEFRLNMKVRQLEWVNLDQVSPVFKAAVLLSEDKRFLKHHGVDWIALSHSALSNLFHSQKRGASTISMQLASMLKEELVPKKYRRSYLQKFKQIQRAENLEKLWTKDQILEAYLNLVSFRGELRGIGAASNGLFNKAPHGLTVEESVILASLIRAPEAPLRAVFNRACTLGKQLESQFVCSSLNPYSEQILTRSYWLKPKANFSPHLVQKVVPSPSTELTLERDLQTMVLQTLQKQIRFLQGRNVRDAAALVVDNHTGQVLAYVGGIGEHSSAPYVDGIQALRQAGSTLKPFLYALAVDKKYLTASSVLEDSPLDIPIMGSIYRPRNYDKEFHGLVSLRTSLASSLNVPAVKVLQIIGVNSFVEKLRELGFSNLKRSDYYGPSLALGAADVTLWELVGAYLTLARQGKSSGLHIQQNERLKHSNDSVFSEEASFIVSDILSDRESRSLTFGFENPLSLRFWTAVKTGTSKDMRDNWCIGYSSKFTVGVWVGNFSGEPMWNVTGITGAAPIWSEVMKYLHRKTISDKPVVPKNLVKQSQNSEWYIKGTEPPEGFRFAPASSIPKISYPVEGMIIAIDPDIPFEFQRVLFEATGSSIQYKWILNGRELAFTQESHQLDWQPTEPGKYLLNLVNTDGKTVDSVRFSVQ